MSNYNELMSLQTFDERFKCLQLNGRVGFDTFGYDRYMNQDFYRSVEWKRVRSFVITRDNGCDLACPDRPIIGRIYIHHIDPITQEDIIYSTDKLLDPNNLICVSQETHNAIHYGNLSSIPSNKIIERKPGDTTPWFKAK